MNVIFIIAGLYMFFSAIIQFTQYHHSFTGTLLIIIGIALLYLSYQLKSIKPEEEYENDSEDEATYYEDETETNDSDTILGAIFLGILFLPFKLLGSLIFGNGKSSSRETSAERFARESREYYANDLAKFQAREARKAQLLSEAQNLENQARYGSPYQQNQLRKQAEDLRRQANRL